MSTWWVSKTLIIIIFLLDLGIINIDINLGLIKQRQVIKLQQTINHHRIHYSHERYIEFHRVEVMVDWGDKTEGF